MSYNKDDVNYIFTEKQRYSKTRNVLNIILFRNKCNCII